MIDLSTFTPWITANQKPLLIIAAILIVGIWAYVFKKKGVAFPNPLGFLANIQNRLSRRTPRKRGASNQLSLSPDFLNPNTQIDVSPQTIELQEINRSLEKRLVELQLEQIKKDIIRDTEGIVTEALPTEQHLVSGNGLIGRPVYFLGGVPVIDIEKEAQRISVDKHLPINAVKRFFFNGGHPGQTLYFYGVTMLSDGKWAMYAISKPPKLEIPRLGGVPKFRLPPLTETYVLHPAAQDSIDNVFINKLETLQQGAAIILSSTVHGPVPLSIYRSATAQVSPERLLNLKSAPNKETEKMITDLIKQVEAS